MLATVCSPFHPSSSVVVMPPDRPLDPIADDLLAQSRLCDLRSDCDELAALKRAAQRPIPILPVDPIQRENGDAAR
jgi:hypothetical protein